MRGIVLAEVRRVQLVTASHPEIAAFQRWLAQRITTNLETKFHERQQERDRLASLLGVPFDALLTQEAMVEPYVKHVYTARPLPQLPPPTCYDCRHCAVDKFTTGGFVCWEGYTPGARPRRLTTFTVCQGFADRRPQPQPPSWYEIKREMDAYLDIHGIRYHAGRWKAHQHDLERQAGTWGFQVGREWEADVRGWFQEHYGAGFFVPQGWWPMAKKKQPLSSTRHLHIATQPPRRPPPTRTAFVDLVLKADRLLNDDQFTAFEACMGELLTYPESQHCETGDPQKLYFAMAAWHWQAQAEFAQDMALVDAPPDEVPPAWRETVNDVITAALVRLDASGGATPHVAGVCGRDRARFAGYGGVLGLTLPCLTPCAWCSNPLLRLEEVGGLTNFKASFPTSLLE